MVCLGVGAGGIGLGDRRLRRRLRDSPGCCAPGATSAIGTGGGPQRSGRGIDACGVGFETRPGASHRARPQRTGWRRLRDSPGCCAPGATSASETGATSANGAGATSAIERGGGTVGRPRAVMLNPRVARLASRSDRPVPGPPHRHAPGPGQATVETSGGRREPTVGRPRLLNPSHPFTWTEHPDTRAARASGRGSPHQQRMGSRDRCLRRRLRDSPGRLRRRARPQRTGRRRLRDSPGRLRRRPRPQRTVLRDLSERIGATSANGRARPRRTRQAQPERGVASRSVNDRAGVS